MTWVRIELPVSESTKDSSMTSGTPLTLKGVQSCGHDCTFEGWVHRWEWIHKSSYLWFLGPVQDWNSFLFGSMFTFCHGAKAKMGFLSAETSVFCLVGCFFSPILSFRAPACQAHKHECDSTSESVNTPWQHFHLGRREHFKVQPLGWRKNLEDYNIISMSWKCILRLRKTDTAETTATINTCIVCPSSGVSGKNLGDVDNN